MARPKKVDSNQLIAMLDNYFTNVIEGDVTKLKYSNLEAYFKTCGVDVAAYNLRRDKDFVNALERLKTSDNLCGQIIEDVRYKTLDIEQLIKSCYDLKSFRKALLELDAYWKNIYQKMVDIAENDKRLKANNEKNVLELARVEKELSVATDEIELLKKEIQTLKKENTYCKGQIRKYIYPAVANKIMRDMRLPAKDIEGVNPAVFTDFIDDKKPASFDGNQGKVNRKVSREEDLLRLLREQVDS